MISLEKKSSISLTKQVPGLNNVRAGLSWDSLTINGKEADADVSVFMLNENSKIPSEGYFVFYNNLKSADGAVVHNSNEGFNFGNTKNAKIRLFNEDNGVQICEFKLMEEHADADSIIIGSFFRGEQGEWKFEAMVNSFNGGLQACLQLYS